MVVDKARGATSHDAVRRLRRVLGTSAVGHAGTLDPMATGVLVVAIGEATKLVPWLTAQDKSYEATIAFGVETDTLDADGSPVARRDPGRELLDALGASADGAAHDVLRQAFEAELSRTHQRPPAHSAIRTGGQRAYARARRGEAVELAPRDVRLRRISVVACSADPPRIQVSVEVSKGYYVRSLARDLAATLGTVGHLAALRRTQSGCFGLDEAVPLDAPAAELFARIQPLAQAAARALPVARLTEAGAREARHGRPVAAHDLDVKRPGAAAWLAPGGELVAIGALGDDGVGRVVRGMAWTARRGG